MVAWLPRNWHLACHLTGLNVRQVSLPAEAHKNVAIIRRHFYEARDSAI
jgi:hypothetical protein